MQELVLTLTMEETNIVLEALGNQPFAKVYTLISKIQAQASEQIKARHSGGEPSAAPVKAAEPGN